MQEDSLGIAVVWLSDNYGLSWHDEKRTTLRNVSEAECSDLGVRKGRERGCGLGLWLSKLVTTWSYLLGQQPQQNWETCHEI